MVDISNPLSRGGQIPSAPKSVSKCMLPRWSAQVEIYASSSSSNFKLSEFKLHWFILQYHTDPEQMTVVKYGREHAVYSVDELETGLLSCQLERIKKYMWENIHLSIQLKDLATLVGMSLFYFSRCFKEITGISPHKYLTYLRIAKSRLLLSTSQTLVEIACDCGFSDQAHFTRTFKRFAGITPHRFRLETS